MKVVDAVWEKRNLGLNVLEIKFNSEDSIVDFRKIDNLSNYKYVVAKVPKTKLTLTHELEEKGFRFIETQFVLHKGANGDYSPPQEIARLSEQIDYEKITTQEGIKRVLDEVEANLFTKDRISLDPYFNSEAGSKRYKYWLNEEYQENNAAQLYELIFRGAKIGFFLMKYLEDKKVNPLLAGLYNKYQGAGLGFSIVDKPVSWANERDIKALETKVSSNNLEVFRLYMKFGYTVRDINYVLRRVQE